MDVIADLNFASGGDGCPSFDHVDFVLFHKKFNAFGVLTNGVIFIGKHLLPVDGRAFAFEAHGPEIVLCLVQHV